MKWLKARGLLAALGIAVLMTSCGQTARPVAEEEAITLLEPVTAAVNTEAAAYRNLYDAKVYSASVYPYTEEYVFSDNQKFAGYAAYPGEEVDKGDSLLYSDSESIDKKIEDMEEKLRKMQEEYEEYKADTEDGLVQPKQEADGLRGIVENLEKNKPEQYLTGNTVSGSNAGEAAATAATGTARETDTSAAAAAGTTADAVPQENPVYTQWKTDYDRYNGQYRILAHSIDMKELQLEQRTQLYQLDSAYQQLQLANLKQEKQEGILTAGMSGNVVAVAQLSNGNDIRKETAVAAVGDLSRKLLKCEYINKATVNSAEDIYALIDGRRYEITYQPMSAEEYTRQSEQGDKVYSTFLLEGAGEEVTVGDFAVITVISDSRRGVLSVPKEAIHKDTEGYYVYVQRDGESIRTYIRTGMSDGVYTEILEGLQEGDEILLTAAQRYGDKTVKVEKGSFHSTFEGSGYLYYPSSIIVKNQVSYGTVYFQEYHAALWQYVEKGDVIATVRVVADELALRREKTKLTRLEERLADLRKQGEEENKKAITAKEKEIAEVRELIAEMEEDFSVTQIKAERSGIVIGLMDYDREDILYKGSWIAEIADEDNCYVVLENTNQLLNYGNKVTVEYQSREGGTAETEGMVANLANAGVSSSLRSEYSLIRLPGQAVGDMAAATESGEGWWNRNRFGVSAVIREMDNVLVVPKKAVRESGGCTYVNVKDKEGRVISMSFIAGGYDSENYWVIEGLTEGMELCLE